jgi:hypothetical protein
MAEQYKLTSTGEFGFAECPLNPGLKSPGTSGFLVVHGIDINRLERAFARLGACADYRGGGRRPSS